MRCTGNAQPVWCSTTLCWHAPQMACAAALDRSCWFPAGGLDAALLWERLWISSRAATNRRSALSSLQASMSQIPPTTRSIGRGRLGGAMLAVSSASGLAGGRPAPASGAVLQWRRKHRRCRPTDLVPLRCSMIRTGASCTIDECSPRTRGWGLCDSGQRAPLS